MSSRFDIDDLKSNVELAKACFNLPDMQIAGRINDIIENLSNPDTITTLGPLELEEYSVLLASYSLYLTTEENKIRTYYNWCERNIEYIVGRELKNSAEYGYTAKNLEIRADNATAAKLDKIKLGLESQLEYLKNVSRKIEFIAERCERLAFGKRKVDN